MTSCAASLLHPRAGRDRSGSTDPTGAPSPQSGARVVRQAEDGSCSTEELDLTDGSTYLLATNDFMAAGGDGYPVVSDRATTRDVMDQVLADYVAEQGTVSPTLQGRITCTGAGCPAVAQ